MVNKFPGVDIDAIHIRMKQMKTPDEMQTWPLVKSEKNVHRQKSRPGRPLGQKNEESNNLLLVDPDYTPNRMLDTLIFNMELKNDAALARAIGITAAAICKIRHLKIPIGAAVLIYCHEASGIGIRELKALANIPAMDRMEVAT